MKSWYQVKVPTGLNHRGKSVVVDKLICLSEAQAKLHGLKVEKSEDPKTILDCAFPIEHAEWLEKSKEAKQEKRQQRKEAKQQG